MNVFVCCASGLGNFQCFLFSQKFRVEFTPTQIRYRNFSRAAAFTQKYNSLSRWIPRALHNAKICHLKKISHIINFYPAIEKERKKKIKCSLRLYPLLFVYLFLFQNTSRRRNSRRYRKRNISPANYFSVDRYIRKFSDQTDYVINLINFSRLHKYWLLRYTVCVLTERVGKIEDFLFR